MGPSAAQAIMLSFMETFQRKSTWFFPLESMDLGTLKYFLGMEVAHSAVCQRKYCMDLITDSGLQGCKPLSTPMDNTLHLQQDSSPLLSNPLPYRRLVGRLIYLTNIRPDIAFATQLSSQFMSQPTHIHFRAAIHVLKYLKGCPGKGYYFFLGNSLISWKAKKQDTVSRSSTEAEYRALASTTCELQWLTYLLKDLHITCSHPAVLYCDNQSALHIVVNLVFHE